MMAALGNLGRNMGRRRGVALSVLASILVAGTSAASGDDLPKAEVVLEKLMEASGGKAHEKIKNRVAKGTLELEGMGVKGPLTVYEARPDKQMVVTELEGLGTIREGTNGKIAWEINPMTGPRIKDGAEAAQAKRGAIFDAQSQWRKLYKSYETVAEEEVDGKKCYKLKMTPTEGPEETWFIDKDTHLMAKTVTTFQSQMGEMPIEAFASDYRDVDGIKIAFKARVVIAGGLQKHVVTVESIEHNVDLPKDQFELPDEIKALVKEGADEGAAEKPKKDENP